MIYLCSALCTLKPKKPKKPKNLKKIPKKPRFFPALVSTLPDITQKLKHGIDELKQRLIDSDTWDRVP